MMKRAFAIGMAVLAFTVTPGNTRAEGEPPPSAVQRGMLIEFFGPSVVHLTDDGQREVAVTLRYDHRIDPSSFRARVEGRDVTESFNPVPGSVEVVRLATGIDPKALVLTARARSENPETAASDPAETEEFVQPISTKRLSPVIDVKAETGGELPEAARQVLRERTKQRGQSGSKHK